MAEHKLLFLAITQLRVLSPSPLAMKMNHAGMLERLERLRIDCMGLERGDMNRIEQLRDAIRLRQLFPPDEFEMQ